MRWVFFGVLVTCLAYLYRVSFTIFVSTVDCKREAFTACYIFTYFRELYPTHTYIPTYRIHKARPSKPTRCIHRPAQPPIALLRQCVIPQRVYR